MLAEKTIIAAIIMPNPKREFAYTLTLLPPEKSVCPSVETEFIISQPATNETTDKKSKMFNIVDSRTFLDFSAGSLRVFGRS